MAIEIKSMGYVRVDSTDPAQWTTFAGKVLGLAEGDEKFDVDHNRPVLDYTSLYFISCWHPSLSLLPKKLIRSYIL